MSARYEPPEFLVRMTDLWEAWREIQIRGHGSAARVNSWRIETLHASNGDTIIRLDVRFNSCGQVQR